MTSMIRCALKRLLAAVAMTAALMFISTDGTKADTGNPFDVLLGSWRGGGQMELSEGKTERLKCNAYYTGGGSRLGVAIRCQSEISNIEFRSKLSQSGGRSTAPGRSAPTMLKEPPPDGRPAEISTSRLAGA